MIPILLYHRIARVPPQHDPLRLTVPPSLFEREMAYLHRARYRCLDLGDAVQCLCSGKRLPRRSFAITFDDGYRDLLTEAWPILQRFAFTATVFPVAGRVGQQSDWDGQDGVLSAPLLSWPEARRLAAQGLRFGSHSLTHRRLTRLDDAEATAEVRDSRALIEAQLGVRVTLFSYPYTQCDRRIQRIVADAGYAGACGGDRGGWQRYNLLRAECRRGDRLLAFRLKASGWYCRLPWLRSALKLARAARIPARSVHASRR